MRKISYFLFLFFSVNPHPSVIDDLGPKRVNQYFKKWVLDSYHLGQELCSVRTMKALSTFVPFYLTARRVDTKIHHYFYNAEFHENRHQPPQWLQRLVDYEIMELPAWICRFFSIAHRDPQERRAMQLFTTGLVWTLFAKLVIKQIGKGLKMEGSLRPLHPGFSRDWKYYHGLPSGHSLLIAFTATYLGLYKGPKYGIPLFLYTGFVMGMRVAGNHHYLSQVITGTAIGCLFGCASYAVLEKQILQENLSINLVSDTSGKIGISLSYQF